MPQTSPEILARIDAVLDGNDTQHEGLGVSYHGAHLNDGCVKCGQLTEAGKGFCRWCADHIDDTPCSEGKFVVWSGPTATRIDNFADRIRELHNRELNTEASPGPVTVHGVPVRERSGLPTPEELAEHYPWAFGRTVGQYAMNLPLEPPVTQVDTELTLETLSEELQRRLNTSPLQSITSVDMHPATRNDLVIQIGETTHTRHAFQWSNLDQVFGLPLTLDEELDPGVIRFHRRNGTTTEVAWRNQPETGPDWNTFQPPRPPEGSRLIRVCNNEETGEQVLSYINLATGAPSETRRPIPTNHNRDEPLSPVIPLDVTA